MHAITARLESCVSATQPGGIKRYSVTTQEAEALFEDEDGDLVLYVDHTKDRDEGLAREAVLKKELAQFQDGYTEQWQSREALQQRLAEAKKLMRDLSKYQTNAKGWQVKVDAFLANPGCADGE